MKKDRIERFVRDNREAFDTHEPAADLWARLETHLGDPPAADIPTFSGRIAHRVRPLHRYWWGAAAAVLLLLAGLGSSLWLTPPTPNADSYLTRLDPQAAQKAFRYVALIETKREEIKGLQKSEPRLYREFAGEIEGLDRDYQRLKADLPQTPNQEELLQAMIKNLQTQVDILNRQLDILQRVRQAKQHHETTT